ncbi:hypothetical protein QBC39DRAFT_97265 [Podospora conica]|nr:hypothetical protein QBC39DRAFT_97265 [Schizothecium conicum]
MDEWSGASGRPNGRVKSRARRARSRRQPQPALQRSGESSMTGQGSRMHSILATWRGTWAWAWLLVGQGRGRSHQSPAHTPAHTAANLQPSTRATTTIPYPYRSTRSSNAGGRKEGKISKLAHLARPPPPPGFVFCPLSRFGRGTLLGTARQVVYLAAWRRACNSKIVWSVSLGGRSVFSQRSYHPLPVVSHTPPRAHEQPSRLSALRSCGQNSRLAPRATDGQPREETEARPMPRCTTSLS